MSVCTVFRWPVYRISVEIPIEDYEDDVQLYSSQYGKYNVNETQPSRRRSPVPRRHSTCPTCVVRRGEESRRDVLDIIRTKSEVREIS